MKSQRRTAQTQVNSSEKTSARLTCFFHRQYSARVPSFMQCVVQLRAAFPEMRLLLLYASSFFRVSPALIPPRRGKSIKKARKSWLFATVLLTCVLICGNLPKESSLFLFHLVFASLVQGSQRVPGGLDTCTGCFVSQTRGCLNSEDWSRHAWNANDELYVPHIPCQKLP